MKRRIFAMLLCIFLLTGCSSQSVPAEQDVNEVDIYRQELMRVEKLSAGFIRQYVPTGKSNAYEIKEMTLSDDDLAAVLKQLKKRLEYMVVPVADFSYSGPTEPITGYEDALLYLFCINYELDYEQKTWYFYFLIDEDNTPQACMAYVANAYAQTWYTFDDPETVVKKFWNDELAA